MSSKIKRAIKASGILVREFAELCGVSRVAVHAWMAGSNINDLRKPRVDSVLRALDAAVAAKDLPFDRPNAKVVSRETVTQKLKYTVIKHLKLLSKAS